MSRRMFLGLYILAFVLGWVSGAAFLIALQMSDLVPCITSEGVQHADDPLAMCVLCDSQ